MTASDASLERRYVALLEAFRDRDLATVQRLVAPNVEVAVAGAGRFAGGYRGLGEVLGLITSIQRDVVPRSGRLVRVTSDGHAVESSVVVTLRDVRGRTQEAGLVHRFEFDDDGRAVRGVISADDQAAFDAFLPPLASERP